MYIAKSIGYIVIYIKGKKKKAKDYKNKKATVATVPLWYCSYSATTVQNFIKEKKKKDKVANQNGIVEPCKNAVEKRVQINDLEKGKKKKKR